MVPSRRTPKRAVDAVDKSSAGRPEPHPHCGVGAVLATTGRLPPTPRIAARRMTPGLAPGVFFSLRSSVYGYRMAALRRLAGFAANLPPSRLRGAQPES